MAVKIENDVDDHNENTGGGRMTILQKTRKLLTLGLLAVLAALPVVLLLGRFPVGVRYASPSS
jgi:hypothetical protein